MIAKDNLAKISGNPPSQNYDINWGCAAGGMDAGLLAFQN
jgi:hypothetical protein